MLALMFTYGTIKADQNEQKARDLNDAVKDLDLAKIKSLTPTAQDINNEDGLIHAAIMGQRPSIYNNEDGQKFYEIINFLVEKGGDVGQLIDGATATPLLNIMMFSKFRPYCKEKWFLNTVSLLGKTAEIVNHQLGNGLTALHMAGCEELRKLLVKLGANVTIMDNQGRMAADTTKSEYLIKLTHKAYKPALKIN